MSAASGYASHTIAFLIPGAALRPSVRQWMPGAALSVVIALPCDRITLSAKLARLAQWERAGDSSSASFAELADELRGCEDR
jgi:hypothetical protein